MGKQGQQKLALQQLLALAINVLALILLAQAGLRGAGLAPLGEALGKPTGQ